MINRREALGVLGLTTTDLLLPGFSHAESGQEKTNFIYSLNTSTISGQNSGLLKSIDIAARAGYDCVELWIRDIRAYLDQGNSLKDLKGYLADNGLTMENAIGFAPWLAFEEREKRDGFDQMKEEMEMVAELGCPRIAAPAAGVGGRIDFYRTAGVYQDLIDLGRETGVMPQLEFWGASEALYNLGQAMMVCAIANDPDVHILADVFHLFRGNSGFESLKMLNGNVLQVFHMNDYPGNKPREEQTDGDRVFPGDGAAPMKEIIRSLNNMGGVKVLSLELFNESYWTQDAQEVARTGIVKMKKAVADAL